MCIQLLELYCVHVHTEVRKSSSPGAFSCYDKEVYILRQLLGQVRKGNVRVGLFGLYWCFPRLC